MLSRGLLLQRSSSIVNKGLNSRFHNTARQWFESFLTTPIPKGFGKFYPPGSAGGAGGAGKTAGETASKSAKQKAGKGKSSGGAGGGGGDIPPEFSISMPFVVAAMVVFYSASILSTEKQGKEISWQEFSGKLLESGQVDRILIANKTTARVVLRTPSGVEGQEPQGDMHAIGKDHDPLDFLKEGGADDASKHARYPRLNQPAAGNASYYFAIGSVESFERKLEDAQKALNIVPRDYVPVLYVDETGYTNELVRLIPTMLMVGLAIAASRYVSSNMAQGGSGANMFKMGKSKAKKVNKELVTTTFADVAGCDEAKREIMEFVEFLKDSKRFTDLGAKIPKGALLCGPPGTGKTLLAKAMAGESNVPFFSISGSDFVEMYVGMGSSRVRDLFKEARANAPCIVFIDEIDAIGRQRGRGGGGGANDERESTLNQLLVEMDGFDPSTNVVVLAGTNRADVLDTALLRPGRFDRQIQVDRPDISGRKAIFEVYLKGITLDGLPITYSARLAALTPGFTGADIANICNEAAILAARRKKTMVDMRDFETATERIIGGLESHKLMSPEIRRVIAYHEAGHAIAGWNLEHADPLLKVTIVPRGGGALGFAQYLPQEIFLRSKEQILDRVCVALAGRASEQVNFGKVTTGASDDLKRVTEIVYQMVQVYGMNDRIGQVAFPREEGQFGPADRLYSNATAEIMDEEVKIIVDEAYRRTLQLMEDKKDQVILVAEMLLAKETITNGDVVSLIGKRPFKQSEEYEKYASSGWGAVPKKEEETPSEEPAGSEEEHQTGAVPAFSSMGLQPDPCFKDTPEKLL